MHSARDSYDKNRANTFASMWRLRPIADVEMISRRRAAEFAKRPFVPLRSIPQPVKVCRRTTATCEGYQGRAGRRGSRLPSRSPPPVAGRHRQAGCSVRPERSELRHRHPVVHATTYIRRLTLNILLFFAQFERGLTAERIRDEVAASRRKGMWMGGVPPYGY